MSAPIKIALISFAHVHAPAYAEALLKIPNAKLAYVWDDNIERGKQMADKYGAGFEPSLQTLLKNEIDGAVITSENSLHAKLVDEIAASKSSVKAVLCEKPISINLAEGEKMISTAKSSGLDLYTAFPCRYSPSFLKALATVQSGKLGKVIGIRATNHGVCPMGWFVETDKSGGGSLIDHTVHVADLNHVLLGEKAVEVYAESGNNMYHQSWEDSAFLTITYAGGAFSTLDSSWSRPPKSFKTWGDVTLEILGEGGEIAIDMFGQSFTRYDESTTQTRTVGWGSNIDQALVADFVKAASGERPTLLATGEDGLAAAKVAFAAYESIKRQAPVKTV
jgi:predicted dehydrogenase